jgi:hypothetical protein
MSNPNNTVPSPRLGDTIAEAPRREVLALPDFRSPGTESALIAHRVNALRAGVPIYHHQDGTQ